VLGFFFVVCGAALCVFCGLWIFVGLLVFVCDDVVCWLCFGCIYLFFDVLLACLCEWFFSCDSEVCV